MQRVYTLTNALYFGAVDAQAAAIELAPLREQLAQDAGPKRGRRGARRSSTRRPRRSKARVRTLEADVAGVVVAALAVRGPAEPPAAAGRGAACQSRAAPDTLWSTTASLSAVMNAMQAADVSPTSNTLNALTAAQANAAAVMARWHALRTVDLPALNLKLKAAGAQPLTLK